jgi:Tfp pilus assembly protein PilF
MRDLLICLCLAVVTAAVYSPGARLGFVNYDDEGYVYGNSHVAAGLTWPNIKWALRTRDMANYHPLTWLSYEMDVSLFGVAPRPMHIENVVLHAVNTALLFLLLRWASGDVWPAAFAAGIFGVHPLHVESVAWISERKDLLSALFFLLASGAYIQFVRGRRRKWIAYVVMVLLFALGLAAKPMIVTFPLVLMLLDYWPLRRKIGILEKIPLLIISAVWCWVTIWAQSGGGVMADRKNLPVAERVANAAVSYARYLGKTVWPTRLSVFYPHPLSWPIGDVALSVILIGGIAGVCFWNVRRRPFLIVGWLMFLGMLVPAIGLVQVGRQSIADRYMYLPMIGLAVMGAWLDRPVYRGGAEPPPYPSPEVPEEGTRVRAGEIVVVVIVLTAFAYTTVHQLQYWRDTRSLFNHALAVTDDNAVAHVQLGLLTRDAEARRHYEEAIRIDPTNHAAEFNLGNLLLGDDPEAALQHYYRANDGNDARVFNNQGIALAKLARWSEAEDSFREAINLDADYADPHCNMGMLFMQLGNKDAARQEFEAALRIDPDSAVAERGLARLNSAPSH